MKKLLIFVLPLFFMTWNAHAYEMGVTFGMQTTDVDTDSAGVEMNAGSDLYAGVLGFIEAGDGGYLRTGAFISMRKYESEFGSITAEQSLTSIDVPLTYLFMFSEYAGVFGGAKLGLNISDDCSIEGSNAQCTDADIEALHYATTLGVHFRFVPNFGIEVEYAMGLSDIAKDVEWSSSLAVGAFYLF